MRSSSDHVRSLVKDSLRALRTKFKTILQSPKKKNNFRILFIKKSLFKVRREQSGAC